jgi:hypothetical protein
VLVKSVALTEPSISATSLAGRGIVDAAFPTYVADGACEAWCIDDARYDELERAFHTGRGVGTRIFESAAKTRPRAAQGRSIATQRRHANITR